MHKEGVDGLRRLEGCDAVELLSANAILARMFYSLTLRAEAITILEDAILQCSQALGDKFSDGSALDPQLLPWKGILIFGRILVDISS